MKCRISQSPLSSIHHSFNLEQFSTWFEHMHAHIRMCAIRCVTVLWWTPNKKPRTYAMLYSTHMHTFTPIIIIPQQKYVIIPIHPHLFSIPFGRPPKNVSFSSSAHRIKCECGCVCWFACIFLYRHKHFNTHGDWRHGERERLCVYV